MVETISAAVGGLARHFPHQSEYFEAACAPTCVTGPTRGFGKPDFMRSTEAFRPERERRDGIEHLAVFPMYKQNASQRHPLRGARRPRAVAGLRRRARGIRATTTAKFVPVNFVDYTSGYDSECAVLFPETFSSLERPPSYFGGIFCDREAERFRRVCRAAAADLLDLNLPPDAACLLTSPELSMDAYVLWDLSTTAPTCTATCPSTRS